MILPMAVTSKVNGLRTRSMEPGPYTSKMADPNTKVNGETISSMAGGPSIVRYQTGSNMRESSRTE